MEPDMSRLGKILKNILDFSLCPSISRFEPGKDYTPFSMGFGIWNL
jgi:hypothetical protein